MFELQVLPKMSWFQRCWTSSWRQKRYFFCQTSSYSITRLLLTLENVQGAFCLGIWGSSALRPSMPSNGDFFSKYEHDICRIQDWISKLCKDQQESMAPSCHPLLGLFHFDIFLLKTTLKMHSQTSCAVKSPVGEISSPCGVTDLKQRLHSSSTVSIVLV